MCIAFGGRLEASSLQQLSAVGEPPKRCRGRCKGVNRYTVSLGTGVVQDVARKSYDCQHSAVRCLQHSEEHIQYHHMPREEHAVLVLQDLLQVRRGIPSMTRRVHHLTPLPVTANGMSSTIQSSWTDYALTLAWHGCKDLPRNLTLETKNTGQNTSERSQIQHVNSIRRLLLIF